MSRKNVSLESIMICGERNGSKKLAVDIETKIETQRLTFTLHLL